MHVKKHGKIAHLTALFMTKGTLTIMWIALVILPLGSVYAESSCTELQNTAAAIKCLEAKIEKQKSSYAQGMWCGLDSKLTIMFRCMGHVPSEKCPEGFQRFSVSVDKGQLETSVGSGKHYTCIKQ